jgi:hypothetical protein
MAFEPRSAPKNLDELAEQELNLQELLEKEHRCPFVFDAYWANRRPSSASKELFWCSIDLQKFYPSLNLNLIRENIIEQLPAGWRIEANRLLDSMFQFGLNLEGWTSGELKEMGLKTNQRAFRHVPTGLHAAGFLANAGMLKIDLEVSKRLKNENIAHFRFVDDHIVLAYAFDDLVRWVREYKTLLSNSHSGVRLNRNKFEPPEIALIINGNKRKSSGKKQSPAWQKAEKKCHLDPEYPSPLMTKTLALISAIARTNFNLLEPQELTALTNQLEHLLLVDIPEGEIQEKTRLSFAATRLTRIAECRLGTPETQADLVRNFGALQLELNLSTPGTETHSRLNEEIREASKELGDAGHRINSELGRAFQLMRRVLRTRPDRTRVWTRAILTCRLTGGGCIADLLADVRRELKKNPLAGEYLHANLLAMLGTQVLIAARTLRDRRAAQWRRQAAYGFLEDLSSTDFKAPHNGGHRWFLRISWLQFCFGLYCADTILKAQNDPTEQHISLKMPQKEIVIGQEMLDKGGEGHVPAQWAWWVGRQTLREFTPHAAEYVREIGDKLSSSRETIAFWRFFPLDVPTRMIPNMIEESVDQIGGRATGGWWVDALRGRNDVDFVPDLEPRAAHLFSHIDGLLKSDGEGASLYQWCNFVGRTSMEDGSDPRCGEWTALEIVRQIASRISEEPILSNETLIAERKGEGGQTHLHPVNFRIPMDWMQEGSFTWKRWQELVREPNPGVVQVTAEKRIEDNRYSPLRFDAWLSMSINPVRGLGLLLYGLLKKSFDLPAIWNGPGHADALAMLPRTFLAEMTCSSWTLGILSGCLVPRVAENLFLQLKPLEGYVFDRDTGRDPATFSSAHQVRDALRISQNRLEDYQLSTLNQKARQLTPVSIKQLTEPEWNAVFDIPLDVDGSHE